LAVLGGADLAVLERAQSERGNFVGLGMVMVATAAVAAVSMVFALENAVLVVFDPTTGAPADPQPAWIHFVAWPLGLMWGALILVVDRALIRSMQGVHGNAVWKYALPRFLLAFVIGAVVSTPITLRIFQGEIAAQVKYTQDLAIEDAASRANSGEAARKSREADEAVAVQEAILDGQTDSASTPRLTLANERVEQLEADVSQAEEAVQQAQLKMVCERGGLGASRPECKALASTVAGAGDLFEVAKAEYTQKKTRLDGLEKQLAVALAEQELAAQEALTLGAPLVASKKQQARTLLCGEEVPPPTIDNSPCRYTNPDRPRGLRAEAASAADALGGLGDTDAIRSNGGLLSQLQALSALSDPDRSVNGDASAAWAHWLVAALFMLIELLPVLIKTLSAARGESQYDRVLKKVQDDEFEVAETHFDDAQANRDRTERKREAIAEDMVKREIELGTMANEHVASEMKTVIAAALAQWSKDLKSTLAHGQNGSSASSALKSTGPPSGNSHGAPTNATNPPPFGLPPKGTI